MHCENCEGEIFGNRILDLIYFDKTKHFCSYDCYSRYSNRNFPSHEKWNHDYAILSQEQKKRYLDSLEEYNKKLIVLLKKYKDDLRAIDEMRCTIWFRPPNPAYYFEHVSEYASLEEFKRAFIQFLHNVPLNDIHPFDFDCQNDYDPRYQMEQKKAIDEVMDNLYGENCVKWEFGRFIDNTDNENVGVYLIICGKTVFFDYESSENMDSFIRSRIASP